MARRDPGLDALVRGERGGRRRRGERGHGATLEVVDAREAAVAGQACRREERRAEVAREERVAAAAVRGAEALDLAEGVHREGAGAPQPALVARRASRARKAKPLPAVPWQRPALPAGGPTRQPSSAPVGRQRAVRVVVGREPGERRSDPGGAVAPLRPAAARRLTIAPPAPASLPRRRRRSPGRAPCRWPAPRRPRRRRATRAHRGAHARCRRSHGRRRPGAPGCRTAPGSRGRRAPGGRAACERRRAAARRSAPRRCARASQRAASIVPGAPSSSSLEGCSTLAAIASARASAVAAEGARRCATSRIPLDPTSSDAPAPSSSGDASAASWRPSTIAAPSRVGAAGPPRPSARGRGACRPRRRRGPAGCRRPACRARRRRGAWATAPGRRTPPPRRGRWRRSRRAPEPRSTRRRRAARGERGRAAPAWARECTRASAALERAQLGPRLGERLGRLALGRLRLLQALARLGGALLGLVQRALGLGDAAPRPPCARARVPRPPRARACARRPPRACAPRPPRARACGRAVVRLAPSARASPCPSARASPCPSARASARPWLGLRRPAAAPGPRRDRRRTAPAARARAPRGPPATSSRASGSMAPACSVSRTRSMVVSERSPPLALSRPRAASTSGSTAARSRSAAARSLAPEPLPASTRLLRVDQRVAGLPQLARGALLRAHRLVGGPRRDGGLGQRLDRGRLVAPPVGAQLLGQRVALGDELLARQAVEAVDGGVGRLRHRR